MIQEVINLNDNIVALTASVDAAVAKLSEEHATPAEIQAAADAVAAETARIDAAVASVP